MTEERVELFTHGQSMQKIGRIKRKTPGEAGGTTEVIDVPTIDIRSRLIEITKHLGSSNGKS